MKRCKNAWKAGVLAFFFGGIGLLPEPPKKATSPLRKSLKIATGLFLLDAVFLNQGIITAVFAGVVLLGFLPALCSAVCKRWPEFRPRMAHFAIYATACGVVFAANYLNNSMADRHAVQLGDACGQFHVKYNRYQRSLTSSSRNSLIRFRWPNKLSWTPAFPTSIMVMIPRSGT